MKFTVVYYLYTQPEQEGKLKTTIFKVLAKSRALPTESFNPIEPIRCRLKCLGLSID